MNGAFSLSGCITSFYPIYYSINIFDFLNCIFIGLLHISSFVFIILISIIFSPYRPFFIFFASLKLYSTTFYICRSVFHSVCVYRVLRRVSRPRLIKRRLLPLSIDKAAVRQ